MHSRLLRQFDRFSHPRQTTVYPGSLSYEVLEFMLAHKLAAPARSNLWCSNVRPLVELHGAKPVLRAITRLRTKLRVEIRKPRNSNYRRPHVWELADPERIRLYPRRAPVSS